MRVMIYIL